MIVPYPWDYSDFVNKMQRSLGDGGRVECILIEKISKCSSSSLNEILDAATTYCCQQQGFKEITLTYSLIDFECADDQLKFDEYLL